MLKNRGRSPSGRAGSVGPALAGGRAGSAGPATPSINSASDPDDIPPNSPRDNATMGGGSHSRQPSSVSVNNSLTVEDINSAHTSPSHTTVNPGDLSDSISHTTWYDHDDLDSSSVVLDPAAKQKAVDQLQKKMSRTKDQIKREQVSKEENVDEYLRLSSSADKHQLARIKQVFEKKNQKSAQTIAQLQKKLENYQRKARDIDQFGSSSGKQTKVLKAVGQGIKSVGGGVVGTLTKPKEFAHLIRNKFGSADNISSLTSKDDEDERRSHHGSASLPREGSTGGSVLSDKIRQSSFEDPRHCASDDGHISVPRSASSITSGSERGAEYLAQDVEVSPRHSATNSLGLKTLMAEINNLREETERLREELEGQQVQFKQELEFLNIQLREEQTRCERLEDQINDLTELHQNEMENIRSGVTDMEEKVQYQSEERIRDIQDRLSGLETKISRMEHQAAQQHQQYVTFEGLENTNARALVVKAINILLTLLQVVLLILETGAQILKPFLKTPTRIVTTFLLVTVFILAVRHCSDINLAIFSKASLPETKKPEL